MSIDWDEMVKMSDVNAVLTVKISSPQGFPGSQQSEYESEIDFKALSDKQRKEAMLLLVDIMKTTAGVAPKPERKP